MRPASLLVAVLFVACGTDRLVSTVETPPAPQPTRTVFVLPDGVLPNHAPVAALRLRDALATLSTRAVIGLDASQSVDADGDALTYEWTVSSGTLTGQQATAELRPAGVGPVTVHLRVSDSRGAADEASLSMAIIEQRDPDAGWGSTGGGGGQTGGGAGGGAGEPGQGWAGSGSGPTGLCPPRVSWGNADPVGDVSLSNADVIASAAAMVNGEIDLRVQFCDAPFPQVATHNLTWCLDTDARPGTSACGVGSGADSAVSMWGIPGRAPSLSVGSLQLDTCRAVSWDRVNRVLRVVLPVGALSGVTSFQYKLGSVFGGSFGANEWSPTHQLSPGMLPLSATLPAFDGVSICGAQP